MIKNEEHKKIVNDWYGSLAGRYRQIKKFNGGYHIEVKLSDGSFANIYPTTGRIVHNSKTIKEKASKAEVLQAINDIDKKLSSKIERPKSSGGKFENDFIDDCLIELGRLRERCEYLEYQRDSLLGWSHKGSNCFIVWPCNGRA